MASILGKLKTFFLDILFPLNCLNCQEEGFTLCPSCLQLIKINDRLESEALGQKLITTNLDQVYLAGDYNDQLLSAVIKKYKYEFLRALNEQLGRFLISFWKKINGAGDLDEKVLVIPLPLSSRRYRWRGFNQAELLAKAWSTYFNYPINSHDLIRIKNRPPQVGLSEAKRRQNIEGVFKWQGGSLKEQTVILIDDIITTGATLNEAARTLKAAGAKSVKALVLAKG